MRLRISISNPAGSSAWTDRSQRQRQDHDAQRHLRLLRAAARCGQAERRRAAGLRSPRTRADADCANVPDPAHCRFRVGAAERHDRRHHRRQGHFRRIIAVAAALSARRSDAARHRHAGVGGSRARAARPCASRSAATQRAALYGDRSRVDAAPGFPAARRAGGWIIGEEIGRLAALLLAISQAGTACCWWSIMQI